jgi:hypothetical protein
VGFVCFVENSVVACRLGGHGKTDTAALSGDGALMLSHAFHTLVLTRTHTRFNLLRISNWSNALLLDDMGGSGTKLSLCLSLLLFCRLCVSGALCEKNILGLLETTTQAFGGHVIFRLDFTVCCCLSTF